MNANPNNRTIFDVLIGIKGAGDLASGIALRLYKANIRNVFLMEVEKPLAVRRMASFSEAVYEGKTTIEGITSTLAKSVDEIQKIVKQAKIPVIVDPFWETIKVKHPDVIIDAIMAKKNTGTKIYDGNLVIGLGPGFEAGCDTHLVIETKRGHNLGKIMYIGGAEKDTSTPEAVNGFTHERVIRSPADGFFESDYNIGDIVKKNEIIGQIDGRTISSQISGVLRGLIHPSIKVTKNMKIADVDPRCNVSFCYSSSDKARSLGGAVLEAILGNYRMFPATKKASTNFIV